MINDSNLAIEAKGLNKIYKDKFGSINKALTYFNINIPQGVTYGLLGPNGAGKSTFINILGGLVIKNSGLIKICGVDIDKNSKKSRKLIGIVPQELNMDPFFTPFELLEIQAGLYGVKKQNRITLDLLKEVNLSNQKNSYSRTLSGGMKRRLLIAKALVHTPKVVILDEPTAGVDIELRQKIWKYIKELNKKGTTVLLTTHYLKEAEKLCDYITILNKGKIVATDTKNNLLNLINKKKIVFILDTKIIKIPNQLNKYNPILNNKELSLNCDKKEFNLNEIVEILDRHKIKVKDINTYDTDLEDVFTLLTKEI